jgi:hypothetical protein
VAVLQLLGTLAPAGPTWYIVFQGVIGVVQFVIALVMLADYRRSGIWGGALRCPMQRAELAPLLSSTLHPSEEAVPDARRRATAGCAAAHVIDYHTDCLSCGTRPPDSPA